MSWLERQFTPDFYAEVASEVASLQSQVVDPRSFPRIGEAVVSPRLRQVIAEGNSRSLLVLSILGWSLSGRTCYFIDPALYDRYAEGTLPLMRRVLLRLPRGVIWFEAPNAWREPTRRLPLIGYFLIPLDPDQVQTWGPTPPPDRQVVLLQFLYADETSPWENVLVYQWPLLVRKELEPATAVMDGIKWGSGRAWMEGTDDFEYRAARFAIASAIDAVGSSTAMTKVGENRWRVEVPDGELV